MQAAADAMLAQLPEQSAVDLDAEAAIADEPRVAARLLEYRRGCFVALPPHTTLELIEHPLLVAVPGAPGHCRGLIAWQDRQLPLLDLHTLLQAYADDGAPPPAHVLVVAFQRAPRLPLEYGALCAPLLVEMIEVADSQQCALPNDSDLWPSISLSCFSHKGRSVPVLDTARLFAQPHL